MFFHLANGIILVDQEILGNPVVRAGIISGSLSLVGDLLAQFLSCAQTRSSYDPARSFRMGSFGLLLYGPYQHYWYNALDGALPARTLTNFALKVFMNQACLAPVVVAGVFTWNLGLQGKLESLSSKCKRDFVPTLVTGWKFWVPAATVNFTMIPLQHQVLYMSACGVIWTAFLSYSSSSSSTESKPNIVYSAK